MTYQSLPAIAATITKMTGASHNGRFFAEEAAQLRGMESTFIDTAVRAAQFPFEIDMEGMAEPLQAYAVITRETTGFDLILTREENYLADHAE